MTGSPDRKGFILKLPVSIARDENDNYSKKEDDAYELKFNQGLYRLGNKNPRSLRILAELQQNNKT